MGLEPRPNMLRHKEIVCFDFSCKWIGRNAEKGISTIVIVVVSLMLVLGGSPCRIIFSGINWVFKIFPGIFETLDGFDVVLHTHSHYEVIVSNLSSVSKNYVVFIRIDLFDTYKF